MLIAAERRLNTNLKVIVNVHHPNIEIFRDVMALLLVSGEHGSYKAIACIVGSLKNFLDVLELKD